MAWEVTKHRIKASKEEVSVGESVDINGEYSITWDLEPGLYVLDVKLNLYVNDELKDSRTEFIGSVDYHGSYDGTYVFTLQFTKKGTYKVYVDLTPIFTKAPIRPYGGVLTT